MNILVKTTLMSLLIVLQPSCTRGHNKENKDSKLANPGTPGMANDVNFFQILNKVRDSMNKAKDNFSQDSTSPYWSLNLFSRNPNGVANSTQIGTIYFKQNARNRGPDISLELDDFDEEMVNIFLTDQRSLKVPFTASAQGQPYPAQKLVNLLTQQAEAMNDPHLKNLAQSLADFARFFAGSYVPNGTRPTNVLYSGTDPKNKSCYVKATFDGDGSLLQISAGYNTSDSTFKSTFYLFGMYKIPYDKCSSLTFDTNPERASGPYLEKKDRKIDFVLKLKGQYPNKKGEILGTNIMGSTHLGLPTSGAQCEVTQFKLCANRAQLTHYSVGVGGVTLLPFLAGPKIGKMEINCGNLAIKKIE